MPPIRLEKPKKTRTAISIDTKKEICKYMIANPHINQGDVASYYNAKYKNLYIDRTTVNKIWKSREKWLAVLFTSQTHIFFAIILFNFQNLIRLCKFGLHKQ